MELNEQQLKAVNFTNGACLVNASAGSGKTRVLVERIARLVKEEGVSPSDILAITFTKNAGDNLVSRLKDVGIECINTGTYHSICYHILSNKGIVIKSPIDFKIQNEFRKLTKGKSITSYYGIMGFINYQKLFNKTPDDEFICAMSLKPILEEYNSEQLRAFYKAYEDIKKREGWLDFTDYLLEAKKLLKQDQDNNLNTIKTYKYLLIDEYQDNNNVQNELNKLLCPNGNIFVVGDVRQCLYSFIGSNPNIFMNFPKENNAEVIDLYTNYRSCKNIVNISNEFIAPYYKNFQNYKDSKAFNNENGNIQTILTFTEEEEASIIANNIEKMIKNGVNPNEIMVIYRNNIMSGMIEIELKKRNIPFDISKEGNFFKRREIEIILCVMRLMSNQNDDVAYEQLFNSRCYPFTFIRKIAINSLSETAYKNNGNLLASFQTCKDLNGNEKSSLTVFSNIIKRLNTRKLAGRSLSFIIDSIVTDLHLKDYIKEKSSTKEDMQQKLDSIEVLKRIAENYELNQFLNFCYDTKNSRKNKTNIEGKVRLMTVHKSKGLEAETVFLMGVNNDKFPSLIEGDGTNEANLFYVGITRAKRNLYVSSSNPSIYFQRFNKLLDLMEEYKKVI